MTSSPLVSVMVWGVGVVFDFLCPVDVVPKLKTMVSLLCAWAIS
jgi:hypothetical protein